MRFQRTQLRGDPSIAMDVVRGNMPITCLSGCIHVLADEIEEIKKKMEEDKESGGR